MRRGTARSLRAVLIMSNASEAQDRAKANARRKALGDACEALALRVLSDPDRPWWILKVRKAHEHEDRHLGIDIVVHLDVGRVLLQVKRSVEGAEKWRAAHPHDPRPIAVLQAAEWEDPKVILGRALGTLILLRERLQALL